VRRYAPSAILPSDRPEVPAAPCAACGSELDPLRAPCTLAFEDGVRLLCGEKCKADYRSGERMPRRMPPTAAAPAPMIVPAPLPVARPERGARRSLTSIPPVSGSDRLNTACVWIGAATVGTAAILAGFTGPETAFAAALLTGVAALAGLRLTWPTVRDVSALGWLLAPLGVIGAAVSAYAEARTGAFRIDAYGAVLAAGALLCRGVLDARARKPVEETHRQLLQALPGRVEIPTRGADPHDTATESTETINLRVGEEIVAGSLEQLGVDGIVRAGEGTLLPYPGASTAIRRVPGDAVLAGGRMIEGALRVLATRVGDDRAIARVVRIGSADERAPSRLLRITQRLMPWGALLSLLGCAALCVVSHMRGLPLPLSAASAILIATPLLALHRAAQWPLQGAATAASARGVLFQSGGALDRAGRVNVVVMAPHRTLTEGKPELLDWLSFGDYEAKTLLALAAGAELSAGDHPIGRAIVRYADKRGIAPREMRRALMVQGRGLIGTGPDGEEIIIGSRRLLLDQGVSVATADAYAARAEAAGRTAVFMAVSGHVRAVFALQDHLRPGARAAVQRFFDLGIEVVLLTGDQRGPVEQLAAGFDIAHIKCELSPDERAHEVRSLREAGGPVAVIGYPSDDAPSLAAADVAIALGATGGSGVDNAIALLSEDLRDAAAALWIARAAQASARGSLRIASTAFVVLISFAAAGWITAGVSALVALLVDAHGIHAGARLVRRVALRFGSGR
jgi:P-type E1-E2 ATPase